MMCFKVNEFGTISELSLLMSSQPTQVLLGWAYLRVDRTRTRRQQNAQDVIMER